MGLSDELYRMEEAGIPSICESSVYNDEARLIEETRDWGLINIAVQRVRLSEFPIVVDIQDDEPVFTDDTSAVLISINDRLDRLEQILVEIVDRHGAVFERNNHLIRLGKPARLSPWGALLADSNPDSNP